MLWQMTREALRAQACPPELAEKTLLARRADSIRYVLAGAAVALGSALGRAAPREPESAAPLTAAVAAFTPKLAICELESASCTGCFKLVQERADACRITYSVQGLTPLSSASLFVGSTAAGQVLVDSDGVAEGEFVAPMAVIGAGDHVHLHPERASGKIDVIATGESVDK